jgi:polyisoprenoid-binding protein YceI
MHRPERLCAASVAAFVLSVSASLGAAGQAAFGPVTEARVTFEASGPAGMKIEGTTGELRVSGSDATVVLAVPLANLTTGIALRDKHMKERYLETATYPEATLSIARGELKLPSTGAGVEADVPGVLTLHGQSKRIAVHYDTKADGGSYTTHGRFHVNMSDFGVSPPSYLGVTVKPEVDVYASFRVAGGGS